MSGVVIIGAGECGTRAAFALRETGYQGPISLVGAEAHLPYERPPLSKRASGGVAMKIISPSAQFADASIDLMIGTRVRELDIAHKLLLLADGSQLSYDKLLLATGAMPRRLACPGSELALPFRTFADAQLAFSRASTGRLAAIIGGGLIGMELAAVLRSLGLEVDVIEASPGILRRAVPNRFADALHGRHIEEGVRFHLGVGIREIVDGRLVLTDGADIEADVIIQAIGVQPDTSLAERAGLAVANGIATDMQMRTSAPDVYAAGDCAAVAQAGGGHVRSESWHNARSQAETAATNIAGGRSAYAAIPSFWSDQYELTLRVIGSPQPAHHRVERQLADGALEFYLDEGRLVAAAALAPGNAAARDMRLSEMLIAVEASPEASLLADAAVDLKQLLRLQSRPSPSNPQVFPAPG